MCRDRKYVISLDPKERKIIKQLMRNTSSSNKRTRCVILLKADESVNGAQTYAEIAGKSGCTENTVIDTLRKFCNGGLNAALTPKRSPNSDTATLKATGEVQARVIAKACSPAPEGRVRWTLNLLAEELGIVLECHLSRSTIGRVLSQNELRPHLSEYWCIPPENCAEFVAAMEDVLDIYHLPYNPRFPVWCMDEKPYQLLDHARNPIPMTPGDITKFDSEYVRNGTVSVFCFIQPHTGQIFHSVQETRTALDWAEQIKYLLDVVNPDCEKVILVCDNLNTHTIASLYKAFKPEEARRLARRLEIHYTPKHGSWLDIAEIGINIMTRECLNRRIGGIEKLREELKAWNEAHNETAKPINWQYSKEDSRIKLKRIYPDIDKWHEAREARRLEKLKENAEGSSKENDSGSNANTGGTENSNAAA